MSHQELEISFYPPNTVKATMSLYKFDGITPITDCTTHSIKVIDPDGKVHSEDTTPTNNTDGTYTSWVNIIITNPLGVYDFIWSIVYDSKSSTEKVQFKVE